LAPYPDAYADEVPGRNAQWRRATTQVAEWAGHSVEVLLRIYAASLVGHEELAKRRIVDALRDA
jgi:hypothetical protein